MEPNSEKAIGVVIFYLKIYTHMHELYCTHTCVDFTACYANFQTHFHDGGDYRIFKSIEMVNRLESIILDS